LIPVGCEVENKQPEFRACWDVLFDYVRKVCV
jgi:hypothetical protein